MSQPTPNGDDHWLTRPRSIRWLWIAFGAILAVTVLLQVFVKVKGTFSLDGSFGFAAWFGFGACLLMVFAARVLGWLLKRPEDYYDRRPTTELPDRWELGDD